MAKTTSPEARTAAAMAAAPVFEGVTRGRVDAFADAGKVRSFKRGTYLCHQGDEAEEVYFLLTGRIEVSSLSPTGSRVLHATVDTPQFIGELGVLSDSERTADLLTLEESEVWTVDGDHFLTFVTSEPEAARQVLGALARQVQEHQAFVDDLLFLDLKGRVAKRLLQMGTPSLTDLPADGTVIPPVTHVDLASLCGGSRENVSRIVSDLQRRGVIKRDGHRYTLKKVATLARMADL